MKLKIEPPAELKELGDSMQTLLAGIAVLAFGAIALSIAAILISVGGRTNGN